MWTLPVVLHFQQAWQMSSHVLSHTLLGLFQGLPWDVKLMFNTDCAEEDRRKIAVSEIQTDTCIKQSLWFVIKISVGDNGNYRWL